MTVSGIAVRREHHGMTRDWVASVPWYYGWIVVAIAFLTVALTRGTYSAYGVLLVAVGEQYDWGRRAVGEAIGLGAVLWAVSAAPLGAALDRWGPRWVFGLSSVVTAAGLAVAAQATQPWHLYLGIGVLGGAGFTALQVNSNCSLVANWFVRRRARMLALVAAGSGLGILVAVPAVEWLIARSDWRAAPLLVAALLLLGLAPLNAALQRRRPEDCGLQPDGDRAPAAPPPPGPTVRQALRSRRYWLLAWGCLLGNIPMFFVLAHGVAVLVETGVSREHAALVAGLGGGCVVVAMLLLGWLTDRWGCERTYTLGSLALLACLGLFALLQAGANLPALLAAPLIGLAYASRVGGVTPVMVAALGQGRALATLIGIVTTHVALGSGLGPWLGSYLFERQGSYGPALPLLASLTLVATAAIWLAAPRHGSLLRAPARTGAAQSPAGHRPLVVPARAR